jgi:hypothetical protein
MPRKSRGGRPRKDYRFRWADTYLQLYSGSKYLGGIGKRELVGVILSRSRGLGMGSGYKESFVDGDNGSETFR